MSSKSVRIKLIILPTNERICLLAKPNNSINELQQLIYQTLIQYPVYQLLFNSCTIMLELRINGQDFAISSYYLIQEILKNNHDIIIVKFVNKSKSMFQRLQPQSIEINKQNEENQENQENEQIVAFDDNENDNISKQEAERKQIDLRDLQNSDIFSLMDKFNDNINNDIDNIDNNNNNNKKKKDEYLSILGKIRIFCLNWFEEKGDGDHLLLNELSEILLSIFPNEIKYLSSFFFITSEISWQLQLFIELGIQFDIDPHIRFIIDFNKNYYQIQWQNHLVFDAENTEKLMVEIKESFINDINIWNEYGFGCIDDSYFNQTKEEWRNHDIVTINGQNLVYHPGWNHLLYDLRNSKLMSYAFNSKQESIKLMKTERFKNSITFHNKYGYTINCDKWLRFCLQRKILPIALLKEWITESQQSFMTKKQFNKFIKDIAKIPSTNINEWKKEKNQYMNNNHNDNENIDYNEKYPIYWLSCSVYNKYLEKYPGKLNGFLCDEMIELFLNDSIQGFNSEAADHEIAELFEHHIVDKFRLMICCINNTLHIDHNIKLLDEKQQISFWTLLRDKYCYGANKSQRGTPDILLNKPIYINNNKIYWLDAKHYFVTPSHKILFKKVVSAVTKYTKAYGSGAIVCNGFQQNVDKHQSIKQYNVTMLDASRDLAVYYK